MPKITVKLTSYPTSTIHFNYFQSQQFTMVSKPFVKWAGGKRQLVSILDKNLPDEFATYYEPFLGGAAMMFHMLSKYTDQRCILSDLNHNLIQTYIVIRDHIDDLISTLKRYLDEYIRNPKEYYYVVRSNEPDDNIERAARLLFLNRTCFNGLYRVNSKGQFNVPFGNYTKPNIINEENLRNVSGILQSSRITIHCRDFESIIDDVKSGDLVYFDPPYQPTSNTAKFTKYTDKDFGHKDLCRLAKLCDKLDRKGCYVLFSNSDSDLVRDLFDHTLWNISRISTNRVINSVGSNRKGHHELLIKNY